MGVNPELCEKRILDNVVYAAVRSANVRLPRFRLDDPQDSSPLYGTENAPLDSLGLVAFIFILEEEFQRAFGIPIKITAQEVLGCEQNPFASLRALSRFLKARAEINNPSFPLGK